MSGNIQCYACRDRAVKMRTDIESAGQTRIVTILSEGAKIALAYLVHSPLERLFSFAVSGEDMRLLCLAAEEYILNQLERGFKSLDFYKEVKGL